MNVFYKKPLIREDKSVVIEQVYELEEEVMPNGIRRKELKVIMELYPNLELLLETVARAQQNYNNIQLQGHKSVMQLELEKKALVDLQVMLSDMLGK